MEEQVMKCLQCGAKMKTAREDVNYGDAGIPDVLLLDVEVSRCPKCGEYEIAVPHVEELHRELAFAIVRRRQRLSGIEFRFLRKYLGYSATDFARTIDVDKATVSRWENGHDAIGPLADRLLRLMVLRQRPIKEYPDTLLAEVAKEPARSPRLRARPIGHTWQAEAA
jgi:putative zinc finger/helix-turn-helix YgiT family protein